MPSPSIYSSCFVLIFTVTNLFLQISNKPRVATVATAWREDRNTIVAVTSEKYCSNEWPPQFGSSWNGFSLHNGQYAKCLWLMDSVCNEIASVIRARSQLTWQRPSFHGASNSLWKGGLLLWVILLVCRTLSHYTAVCHPHIALLKIH